MVTCPGSVRYFRLLKLFSCYVAFPTDILNYAPLYCTQQSEEKMTTLFAAGIFGLGPSEIIVILVVGVLLFGKRLPDMGRYLGKSITEFKKGMKGLEDDVDQHASAPYSPPVGQPMHNPGPSEAIRAPQRVAATAPKFEDTPAQPPQV